MVEDTRGARIERFLSECRKRQLPAASGRAVKQQLLLPIQLHADVGQAKEAKEQLLWKISDSSVLPSMAVQAFCQQHLMQQQSEREAARLQRDLEKLLEQHRDLAEAPSAPCVVKLDIRVVLPHLHVEFVDEPLFDLSAPRAASESYVGTVCNELALGWQAHTLILRRVKDAIDAARENVKLGKLQLHDSNLTKAASGGFPRLTAVTEQGHQPGGQQAANALPPSLDTPSQHTAFVADLSLAQDPQGKQLDIAAIDEKPAERGIEASQPSNMTIKEEAKPHSDPPPQHGTSDSTDMPEFD